jgi:hypothetical protein
MAWNSPVEALPGGVISADFWNQQIRDNLVYLKSGNMTMIQGKTGAAVTFTSVSFAAIDDDIFSLGIELDEPSAVQFMATLPVQVSTANNFAYFDVLVDGATYLSSGTSTPEVGGISYNRIATITSVLINWVSNILPAGVHTFALRGKFSGTGNFSLATDVAPFQMRLKDVGQVLT